MKGGVVIIGVIFGMASRSHRWPGGDTPLSGFHGGKAKAATRAVKDASRDAARYAAWVEGGKKPSPSAPIAPKKDRKHPSAEMRAEARTLVERITEYQLGRCLLCGTTLDLDTDFETHDDRKPSLDHVLPRSRGGVHVGNRLAAHRKCNSDKSNRLPTGCELVWLAAVNARLGASETRCF